jgi:DNA invertase Pin-like site-specific DNA recombinase
LTTAGYIRVSSANQRDKSDSPASQRQQLKDAGCIEFFEDLAVSGYRLADRRKANEFQRLWAAIAEGRISKLLATRLDRYARRDSIVLELADHCQANGVEFATMASGAMDTSTATGWLSVKMQLLISEHFSRQLSENVRNGYEGLYAQGIPARAAVNLPFHLQRVEGTRRDVEPSPAWDGCRFAVEQLLAGFWTAPDVSAFFWEKYKRHQQTQHAAEWLRLPALAGHFARKGGEILIRDCWPALVTDDEFARIEIELQKSKRVNRAKGRSDRHVRAMTGLCSCLQCGRAMALHARASGPNVWVYVKCQGRDCKNACIRADRIEDDLVPMVIERVDLLVADALPKAATVAPEVTRWRKELAERQKLQAEFRTGADQKQILKLQDLIANAANAAPVAHQKEVALLKMALGSQTKWFERAGAERNRLLRVAVDRVILCPETKRIAEVIWR